MRRDKLVDNKYVERFARMCEELKVEQKEERRRVRSGEMTKEEALERYQAWAEISLRFNPNCSAVAVIAIGEMSRAAAAIASPDPVRQQQSRDALAWQAQQREMRRVQKGTES